MIREQGFVNILIVIAVLAVIGGAGYFVLTDRQDTSSSQKQPEATTNGTPPKLPVNTENITNKKEPQKIQVPLSKVSIQTNLTNALNKNDYPKIESFMSAQVQFTIESFDCCGLINRTEVIKQMKYRMTGGGKFDFSQEQEKVKQAKKYLVERGYINSCTDVVIGVGVIGHKSVLTLCISKDKIIAVRLAQSYVEYGIAPPRTATLTILSPNGGETLARGATYTIKWNNPDDVGPFDINLVKNSKIRGEVGFAPGSDAIHSFTWKVEPIGADIINRTMYSLPDGNDYKIRISNQDGDIFDESDSAFSIVSQ